MGVTIGMTMKGRNKRQCMESLAAIAVTITSSAPAAADSSLKSLKTFHLLPPRVSDEENSFDSGVSFAHAKLSNNLNTAFGLLLGAMKSGCSVLDTDFLPLTLLHGIEREDRLFGRLNLLLLRFCTNCRVRHEKHAPSMTYSPGKISGRHQSFLGDDGIEGPWAHILHLATNFWMASDASTSKMCQRRAGRGFICYSTDGYVSEGREAAALH